MKIALLFTLTLLGGCATLTRGSSEVLVVETDPVGADVEIVPDHIKCKTPCTARLKRKHMYIVHIRKDGYEPVNVDVLPQIAGSGAAGMAGNLVFGGLIGAAVDASTGATKQLKPNPLTVKLNAVAPPSPAVSASEPSPAVLPPASPSEP